jgi:TrkA domain protein
VTDVRETKLPGVGVRHDFETASGKRVGVIVHHAGHRELLIYDDRDPDLCRETLRIDEHEAHALAEMLGATQVLESVETLRQSVEGVTIDWLPIDEASVFAGRTIGELELRRRTGVTIIAVIRGGRTMPTPGPELRLEADDTAVVVGPTEAIAQALSLLHGS